jgi:hypothetical protein
MTVIDRIKQIIEYKNISVRQFCIDVGIANGFLDKVKDVGSEKLLKILYKYSDISPEWLLTGNGKMLKESIENHCIVSSENNTSAINERINFILYEFGYKSKRAFALKLGISQTSFNDIINGAEPKFSTLEKIMKAEPLINAEWLLTGKGNFLKEENNLNTPSNYSENSGNNTNQNDSGFLLARVEALAIENSKLREEIEQMKSHSGKNPRPYADFFDEEIRKVAESENKTDTIK